jgi:hypothetical protein
MQASQDADEALARAYPYRPELMDEDFRGFARGELSGGQNPGTRCRDNRNLIHIS